MSLQFPATPDVVLRKKSAAVAGSSPSRNKPATKRRAAKAAGKPAVKPRPTKTGGQKGKARSGKGA